MKKIGVLFGMENSFPGALVEHINARNIEGIHAEFVETGAVHLDKPPRYSVIVDRISHDIPFYRAFLKHAALNGTVIINNPFWWSADDKFFNYTLAAKLGVAVPPTVILPHKKHPEGTTDRSMRNLEYPLNWDCGLRLRRRAWVYEARRWRRLARCASHPQSRGVLRRLRPVARPLHDLPKGRQFHRVLPLLRRGPEKGPHHALRSAQAPRRALHSGSGQSYDKKLLQRVEHDALKLCRALGYDLNTVEFAVENGIPYAIDFMNPAPDADLHSVGEANFEWIVKEVADLAIAKAQAAPKLLELRWSAFLSGTPAANAPAKKPAKKKAKIASAKAKGKESETQNAKSAS